MTIEQDIIDDKLAIDAANADIALDELKLTNDKAILDAAVAKLATDEAALAAAQVHLTVIDEIEAYIVANLMAITTELKALLDKARALVMGK